MREWLQKNQGMATVIAVVILIVALALVFMGGGDDGGTIGGTYYYDLNTNELFTSNEIKVPPFETESGSTPQGEPAGVEAIVYACSEEECAAVTTENIGYLLKFTVQGLQIADQLDTVPLEDRERRQQLAQAMEYSKLARLPGETEWLPIQHPKIGEVRKNLQRGRCGGHMPVMCNPQ